MIDDKFSTAAFAALGLDTKAARERADLLANEVYDEIYEVIEPRLREIVNRLNSMGHNLELQTSSAGDISYPGDIDYRDDFKDRDGYHCRLRLAVDTVVSTGYGHLASEDEA